MPRYFDIDTIRPSSTIVPARILFQTIRRAYFRPIARSNKSPKYVILRLNKSPNSNSYPILTGGRNPEKQDGGRTVDGCVRRGRSTTAGLYGHGAHLRVPPQLVPLHAVASVDHEELPGEVHAPLVPPHLTLLTQHPELKRPHIITLTSSASRTETPPYHHPHALKTRPISPSLLSIQNWNAPTSSPSRPQHPELKCPHIITLTRSRRAPSHPPYSASRTETPPYHHPHALKTRPISPSCPQHPELKRPQFYHPMVNPLPQWHH